MTNPSSFVPTPSMQTYVVQPGDAVSTIAAMFGVTTEAVMAANGLGNPNLIYPGQVLNIPAPTPSVPPGWKTHTVWYGDSLASIAAKYGVTVEAIMAANGITNPAAIYPGQVLKIPPPVAQPGPLRHTVRYGETLGVLAQMYGVSLQALMAANGIANANHIYAGQVLTIPLPVATQTYSVQPGENLSIIAVRYGLTLEALAAMNNIAPPYAVYPGQVIRVPPAGPGIPNPPPAYQTYTVPPGGEPFFAIAIRFNVSQEALAAANGMQPPYVTTPGQVLRIPVQTATATASTEAAAPGIAGSIGGGATPNVTPSVQPTTPAAQPQVQSRTHTVKQGENILSIALQYGLKIEDLGTANGLEAPYPVTPGQVLRLP